MAAVSESETSVAPRGAGCVVFLVDESQAQEARIAEGTRTKAECIATAINSLLAQCSEPPEIDLGLIGYRGCGGEADAASRWSGPLADRQLASSGEVVANPATVENRARKVPGPGGMGIREETVRFPIWYVPALGPAVQASAAYNLCALLLEEWAARSPLPVAPPLVLSFISGSASLEPLTAAAAPLHALQTPGGPPVVLHIQLGTAARVPALVFPSAGGNLPAGPVRDAFEASSPVPDRLWPALRQAQVTLNPGARGLIHNGKMPDLIRLSAVLKGYRQWAIEAQRQAEAARDAQIVIPVVHPAVVVETAPPAIVVQPEEQTVAATPVDDVPAVAFPAAASNEAMPAVGEILPVLLLLDRSASLADDDPKNVARRLQDRANEMLADLARRMPGKVEVAVVAYGADPGPVIETGFLGPLTGRPWVPVAELEQGVLRVEEVAEQISNGIGGLIPVRRKKPIYLDWTPSEPASPVPAFEKAAELIGDWTAARSLRPPVLVIHLTRGALEPEAVAAAFERLAAAETPLVIYHLVLTEAGHRSLAYPADPSGIDLPGLRALWERTSPLLAVEKLAARRSSLSPASRGMVVNGKFDLLLEGIS